MTRTSATTASSLPPRAKLHGVVSPTRRHVQAREYVTRTSSSTTQGTTWCSARGVSCISPCIFSLSLPLSLFFIYFFNFFSSCTVYSSTFSFSVFGLLLTPHTPLTVSEGVISDCQHKHNCGGMCQSEVRGELTPGGHPMGVTCAVPCKSDRDDAYDLVPKERARIMVVGDSITHGMQDDFTWRWRLYHWSKFMNFSPDSCLGYLGINLMRISVHADRPFLKK